MPAPYSEDLRLRVVSAYANKEGSQEDIARRFKIGFASMKRYWRQYQLTGGVSPILEKSGRPPAIHPDQHDRLRQLVTKYPDATLGELCQYYNRKRRHKVGTSIMHRVLNKLGFRRKKKSHYAEEQEREDIKK